MTGISQSAFLQALGLATINSFWQMGLLWCMYLVANKTFHLTAKKQYLFSILATFAGFCWFLSSFFIYLFNGSPQQVDIFSYALAPDHLNIILTSASVAYLSMLSIPVYRFYKNWRFTKYLSQNSLQKADVLYKLFVQKVSGYLGIKRQVKLHLSELITSPVTLGFIKPIILLPVATLNHLSPQQVEAILLHELSHIKRNDYLINIILSGIQTLMYFNPFTRLFVQHAESAREECCDQMVLQFGYNGVTYAEALYTLEKQSTSSYVFAIGAAQKPHLLQRIEKILGIDHKKVLKLNHLIGFVFALLIGFTIHPLFVKERYLGSENSPLFISFTNPYHFLDGENEPQKAQTEIEQETEAMVYTEFVEEPPLPPPPPDECTPEPVPCDFQAPADYIIPASFNLSDQKVNEETSIRIKETVAHTKKALTTIEWKNVEEAIGDAMTEEEKQVAKKDYLKAIEEIDWSNLEKNLKASFDEINWQKVNSFLSKAAVISHIDSLKNTYSLALSALEKEDNLSNSTVLFPDVTVEQLKLKKKEIRKTIDSLNTLLRQKSTKL